MSRLTMIQPQFVEFVPKELEDGILYISIPYSTTVHKCACGCGSKITLPINPARWRFLWDGERISLWPSVGNWSYLCQSHYCIEQNQIEWARTMSVDEIERNRTSDKAVREGYLGKHLHPEQKKAHSRSGLIDRFRGFFHR